METLSVKATTALDLGGGVPGYLLLDYQPVPAGHHTFNVYAAADTDHHSSLGVLTSDLEPGEYDTLLLTETDKKEGNLRCELIHDGNDRESGNSVTAQITIRSFAPGIKEMQITCGDSLTAHFMGTNGFLQMRGLRMAVYQVHATGTDVDGKVFEWSTEIDFHGTPHCSLVVMPDAYGRLRPHLWQDGPSSSLITPTAVSPIHP